MVSMFGGDGGKGTGCGCSCTSGGKGCGCSCNSSGAPVAAAIAGEERVAVALARKPVIVLPKFAILDENSPISML